MPSTPIAPAIQKPTGAFVAASWTAMLVGALTFLTGLWNATLSDSEKGFYAMSFLLALFGSVAVQKNIRDLALFGSDEPSSAPEDAHTA
jgi:uncharacterized membrane protein YiaA